MALYLIVAHQTAPSPELMATMHTLVNTDEDARFVLLVPATETKHLLTWIEGDREEVANARADEAASDLRRAGFTLIDTVVGPPDPLQAIREEVASRSTPYAAIIISTLRRGTSMWLRWDLPSQVRRQLGIEVIHVVASEVKQRTPIKPALRPTLSGSESGEQALSLQEIASWRGKRLFCLGGDLGEVREILYDYVTLEPVWLAVASRPLPFRMLLVPAQAARVVDGYLTVPLTSAKILGQPHAGIGEGFASLTEEEHIYSYFGLPYNEVHDIRVLREGQPVPGSQRNWQSIVDSESASSQRW